MPAPMIRRVGVNMCFTCHLRQAEKGCGSRLADDARCGDVMVYEVPDTVPPIPQIGGAPAGAVTVAELAAAIEAARKEGAEDMRERAANECQHGYREDDADRLRRQTISEIIDRIALLPTGQGSAR